MAVSRPASRGSTSRHKTFNAIGPGRALGQVGVRSPTPPIGLEDAEVEQEFGGRFLPEYDKKRLLGRGACGAVWLAIGRDGASVAVKQIVKGCSAKSRADERAAGMEISVGSFLFSQGGIPRISATIYPGMQCITKFLDARETSRDLWLVMEYGGKPLTKLLYEIKGEFVARGAAQPRERVYRVHHLPFLTAMKQDPCLLKSFLRQALEAIRVLSDNGIVHSDLKPDNILVESTAGGRKCEVRLCDFGSAFMIDQPKPLTLATPEYMPPETLSNNTAQQGQGHALSQPWSFDVWSLGAILLELCYGIPHWLSYKCRVKGLDGKKDHSLVGLFAVPGRDHDRILQRQYDVIADVGVCRVLRDAPGIPLCGDGLDLLQGMLELRPDQRISPQEALLHPFLAE